MWDAGGVRITAAPTDHRPVEPTLAFRFDTSDASAVLAGDTVPCTSLDALASGADALVHTAIRADLVRQIPFSGSGTSSTTTPRSSRPRATAARAGVGTLADDYVPPPGSGQKTSGRARGQGVQRSGRDRERSIAGDFASSTSNMRTTP